MPFLVHALDSRPLRSRFIREATAPLCMVTHGGHKETIIIFRIDSPAYSVVLGLLRWKVQTRSPPCAFPPEYADLALAFCKKKETQLITPHRGDCAIDFLIDAALPRSHVYPLSQAETVFMETCLSIPCIRGTFGPPLHPSPLVNFFRRRRMEVCARALTIEV